MGLFRGNGEVGPLCLSSRSEEERIEGVKEMIEGEEKKKNDCATMRHCTFVQCHIRAYLLDLWLLANQYYTTHALLLTWLAAED